MPYVCNGCGLEKECYTPIIDQHHSKLRTKQFTVQGIVYEKDYQEFCGNWCPFDRVVEERTDG